MLSSFILIFLFGLFHGIQADHLIDIIHGCKKNEIEKAFVLFSLRIGFFHVSLYLFFAFLVYTLGVSSSQTYIVMFFLFGGYVIYLFYNHPKKLHQHDHLHEHTHPHKPAGHVSSGVGHSHTHEAPMEIDKKVKEPHDHVHPHEHDHQHLHMHNKDLKDAHQHLHYKNFIFKVIQREDLVFFLALGAYTSILSFSSWFVCAAILLSALMISAFLSSIFYKMGGIEFMEKCTNSAHLLSGILALLVGFLSL